MPQFGTAWITGASTGIGQELSKKLLSQGTRVAMTARHADKIHAFRDSLPASQQTLVLPLPADVANHDALSRAYAKLKDFWGAPDLLVANAGTHINMQASQIDWVPCRDLLSINLLGAVDCIILVLPDMLARKSGYIAGVGSLSAYRGLPWAAAYGASKAGLNNFLQSLRFDVETHGITVSAINPGFVQTPLTDRNPFPMPMKISAEKAAEYIWTGLLKKKKEIHFPPAFSWSFKLLRILPYPMYHAIIRKITGSASRRE
ncbi:SDR family NAD(P)-dependent oxidoreductase [Desulfobaculum bizertense]|uniref:SDR family NAD(P)-dependent oxidoreductase n=1 Tax=Desulfobaculum bizertense TaxID=376490 RepID=UPI001F288A11|nr:SDR family NAD(P)-dependent oxidoreductase [Desulfobaculum bizertense]UIJ38744.1 SDR family NAD(P)-dependent oxidoreductase [Desulfobaculum bizertense]